MQEIIYLEIPTPDTKAVCHWLQQQWTPLVGKKIITPDGVRLQLLTPLSESRSQTLATELSIFIWSVQRTTYLKIFRWGDKPFPSQGKSCQSIGD
jgi:lycopene cyclase CruA